MLVKSDGGYNYDTTDMAAARYRLIDEKALRVVYITDAGQAEHFEKIFTASEMAGWYNPKVASMEHMPFGLVQKEGGTKFKTSDGDNIKLMTLLDEAQNRALLLLMERSTHQQAQPEKPKPKPKKGASDKQFISSLENCSHLLKYIPQPQRFKPTQEEVKEEQKQEDDLNLNQKIKSLEKHFTQEQLEALRGKAEKIGMAAVKYFDLKQNRIGNYIFSYKKMLDPKGDSAVYLLYAYARICSILKKSGLTDKEIIEMGKEGAYTFSHPHELIIVKKIAQFPDILALVVQDLKINLLCDYTYNLCVLFSEGYNKYKIVGEKDMK